MVLWSLLSPPFCPLKPQLVETDGRPSWFWFWWRFLPVKREFFLSTVASCTLRTGDWLKEKFQCNLLVSWAGKLFFWIGSVWMNWTNFELWIMITMNWTVLLKCPEMTFVVIWRYINIIELNIISYLGRCRSVCWLRSETADFLQVGSDSQSFFNAPQCASSLIWNKQKPQSK